MRSGFAQLRRGLQDHVIDGRISFAEYGAYCWMIQSADAGTGVWWGSARALAIQVGIADRLARHLLESLENKQYLKRFATPRSHRNYPVVINRFICSRGAHRNKMVNTEKTTDWREVSYEEMPTEGAQTGAQAAASHRPQGASILEVEVNSGEGKVKSSAAQTAARRLYPRERKALEVRREITIGKGPEAFSALTPEQREAGWRRAFGEKVAK